MEGVARAVESLGTEQVERKDWKGGGGGDGAGEVGGRL